MQSVSSRIWIRVTVSISYDDNHYTTGTSSFAYLNYIYLKGSSRCIVASVLGVNIAVSEFELHISHYNHFYPSKSYEPLYHPH